MFMPHKAQYKKAAKGKLTLHTTPFGSTSNKCLILPRCIPLSTYCPGEFVLSRTKKSPSSCSRSSVCTKGNTSTLSEAQRRGYALPYPSSAYGGTGWGPARERRRHVHDSHKAVPANNRARPKKRFQQTVTCSKNLNWRRVLHLLPREWTVEPFLVVGTVTGFLQIVAVVIILDPAGCQCTVKRSYNKVMPEIINLYWKTFIALNCVEQKRELHQIFSTIWRSRQSFENHKTALNALVKTCGNDNEISF